jgi:hypothetical protein
VKLSAREAELRTWREAEVERQEKLLPDGRKPVNTSAAVNTKAVNTTRRADRHSPGYMSAYMKRWRRDHPKRGVAP